jgi:hypothetical protein
MWFRTLWARLRQSLFPREIQIAVDKYADPEGGLAELFAELSTGVRALEKALAEATKPVPLPVVPVTQVDAPPPTRSEPVVDTELFVSFCNDLCRLKRNVQTIANAGPETKEVRSMKRVVERLDDALKSRGFEYFEKAGTRFDPRDIEFEPKGQPVTTAGLSQPRIGPCECPVVKLKGKIIQRAQGLVEVPDAKN